MADAATPTADLAKLLAAEVLKNLDVDPQKGLSSGEAQSRLTKYGANALEEKKESPWA